MEVIDEAIVRANQATTDFLSQVATLVSYGAFIGASGKKRKYLSVERFALMRKFLMYEIFATDLSEAEICGHTNISLDTAARYRRMKELALLRKMILQAALDLGTPRTMVQASEHFEAPLVSGVLTTAMFGQGRDRLKAIDEFHGRQSSKKGREGEEVVVRLPPEFEELIARAQRTIEIQGEDVTPKELEPGFAGGELVPMPDGHGT